MLIRNYTNLDYEMLGKIIDEIISRDIKTVYFGEVDSGLINFGGHKIKIQIRYLKKYTEWSFYEEL